MNENCTIEIKQCGNGFIVTPALDYAIRDQTVMLIDDTMVFQSFAELTDFLTGHFKHRNERVTSDAIA